MGKIIKNGIVYGGGASGGASSNSPIPSIHVESVKDIIDKFNEEGEGYYIADADAELAPYYISDFLLNHPDYSQQLDAFYFYDTPLVIKRGDILHIFKEIPSDLDISTYPPELVDVSFIICVAKVEGDEYKKYWLMTAPYLFGPDPDISGDDSYAIDYRRTSNMSPATLFYANVFIDAAIEAAGGEYSNKIVRQMLHGLIGAGLLQAGDFGVPLVEQYDYFIVKENPNNPKRYIVVNVSKMEYNVCNQDWDSDGEGYSFTKHDIWEDFNSIGSDGSTGGGSSSGGSSVEEDTSLSGRAYLLHRVGQTVYSSKLADDLIAAYVGTPPYGGNTFDSDDPTVAFTSTNSIYYPIVDQGDAFIVVNGNFGNVYSDIGYVEADTSVEMYDLFNLTRGMHFRIIDPSHSSSVWAIMSTKDTPLDKLAKYGYFVQKNYGGYYFPAIKRFYDFVYDNTRNGHSMDDRFVENLGSETYSRIRQVDLKQTSNDAYAYSIVDVNNIYDNNPYNTIEFAFDGGAIFSYRFCPICSFGSGANAVQFIYSTSMHVGIKIGTENISWYDINAHSSNGHTFSCVYRYSGGKITIQSVYIDGALVSVDTSFDGESYQSSDAPLSAVSFPASVIYVKAADGMADLMLYALRTYGCSLSAAEIRRNRLADQIKFGF